MNSISRFEREKALVTGAEAAKFWGDPALKTFIGEIRGGSRANTKALFPFQ
jgi:hypothetical protein